MMVKEGYSAWHFILNIKAMVFSLCIIIIMMEISTLARYHVSSNPNVAEPTANPALTTDKYSQNVLLIIMADICNSGPVEVLIIYILLQVMAEVEMIRIIMHRTQIRTWEK